MCFCEVNSFPKLNDKPVKNKNENSNSYYNSNTSISFKIQVYHRKIRGSKNKINEFTSLLFPEYPLILCLTEHDFRDNEIDMISLEHYKLATKFCRQKLKNGGVSIFVHESINFIGIDLQHRCKEQDTEICAIKMNLNKLNIIIIAIYRSPTGDFNYI
jgi:hypothetical protein